MSNRDALTEAYGHTKGTWMTVIAFFGGIFLIGIIDKLVLSFENPHSERIYDKPYKTVSRPFLK